MPGVLVIYYMHWPNREIVRFQQLHPRALKSMMRRFVVSEIDNKNLLMPSSVLRRDLLLAFAIVKTIPDKILGIIKKKEICSVIILTILKKISRIKHLV